MIYLFLSLGTNLNQIAVKTLEKNTKLKIGGRKGNDNMNLQLNIGCFVDISIFSRKRISVNISLDEPLSIFFS